MRHHGGPGFQINPWMQPRCVRLPLSSPDEAQISPFDAHLHGHVKYPDERVVSSALHVLMDVKQRLFPGAAQLLNIPPDK